MAARSMSTATISFGLVSVPIRLYAASESAGRRLVQPAPREVRLAPEAAVHLPQGRTRSSRATRWSRATSSRRTSTSPSPTTSSRPWPRRRSKAIEITEFVPAGEGRPDLLRQGVLPRPRQGRREGLPAAARGHAADRPVRARQVRGARQAVPRADAARSTNGLVMQQLLYADEVRPFAEVPVGRRRGASEPELKLAVQLIEQIATDEFKPRDTTRTRCAKRDHEAIQRKVEGQEITAPAPEAPKAPDHRPDGGAQGEPRQEGPAPSRAAAAPAERETGQEARTCDRAGARSQGSRRRQAPMTSHRVSPRRGPDLSHAPSSDLRLLATRSRASRATSSPASAARACAPGAARSRRSRSSASRTRSTGAGRCRASAIRAARLLDRRPRPRRARRQPHRPRLHRRPLRRFPLRRPAPRRLREPADLRRARRRPAARRLLRRRRRPLRAARQPADARGDRTLPRVPRTRVERCSAACARCSASARWGRMRWWPCCERSGASLRGRPSRSAMASATTSGAGCASSPRSTRHSRTPSRAS